jgi:hypothetical protein
VLAAGQMDRIILRKSKLSKANQLRNRSRKSALERPHFWYDSLPEPPFEAHSLESLHRLVQELFLKRWDDYLEELQQARRAGRPKSKEQVEVEEIKRQEEAEYDSGFGASPCPLTRSPPVRSLDWQSCGRPLGPSTACSTLDAFSQLTPRMLSWLPALPAAADLPDLTHPPTVALLRTWNAKDASFLPLLRVIRISRREPDVVVLVRAGQAKGFKEGDEQPAEGAAEGDAESGMDVDGAASKAPAAVKGLEKGMIGRLWRGPHVDKP